MKLSSKNLVAFSSALFLASLAAGCASSLETVDEEVATSEDELSLKQKYAGSYRWDGKASFFRIESIDLSKDFTFRASMDVAALGLKIKCVSFPCTVETSGRWYMRYGSFGSDKLVLTIASLGKRFEVQATKDKSGGLRLRDAATSKTDVLTAAPSVSTCAAASMKCAQGRKCVDDPVAGASCQPINTCANVKCEAGTICVDHPATGPECLPDVPTCASTKCAGGTTCVDHPFNGASCVPTGPVVKDGCVIGGCSGEICANLSMASACVFRPEFACYQAPSETCEKNASGICGWKKTATLTACLAK